MALSEAAVWVHKTTGLIADISLSLFLSIHYGNWFAEHDIRMNRHTGNLSGFLCCAGIYLVSHAIVSYFQTLAWFLMLDDLQGSGS